MHLTSGSAASTTTPCPRTDPRARGPGWPRGLRKAASHLDDWAKDVAPSRELRMRYRHDPAKFGEFRRATAELAQPGPQAALGRLRALAAKGPVTLLTATRDIAISQAAVLAQLLQDSE